MPDPTPPDERRLADEEALLALLAGALAPAEEAELRARLEREPELAALEAELLAEGRALEAALQGAPAEQPPAELAERVVAHVRAASAGPARPRGQLLRWGALLTAAAAVALVVLSLERREPAPQAMRRQVRTSELLALGLLPGGGS